MGHYVPRSPVRKRTQHAPGGCLLPPSPFRQCLLTSVLKENQRWGRNCPSRKEGRQRAPNSSKEQWKPICISLRFISRTPGTDSLSVSPAGVHLQERERRWGISGKLKAKHVGTAQGWVSPASWGCWKAREHVCTSILNNDTLHT